MTATALYRHFDAADTLPALIDKATHALESAEVLEARRLWHAVLKRFHYDPKTGFLTNRNHDIKSSVGARAEHKDSEGYLLVSFNCRKYRAHRIAFIYMLGKCPEGKIDHINGVRDDNRWSNLRPATDAENAQNCKIRSDNTTGFIGVSVYKGKRYRASIRSNGQLIHLGIFTNPSDAYSAYLDAKRRLHPFAFAGATNG